MIMIWYEMNDITDNDNEVIKWWWSLIWNDMKWWNDNKMVMQWWDDNENEWNDDNDNGNEWNDEMIMNQTSALSSTNSPKKHDNHWPFKTLDANPICSYIQWPKMKCN